MTMKEEILVELENVRVRYRVSGRTLFSRRQITALDGVSLQVRAHEALGIVGESGCGKSTLARAMLRLVKPDDGRIRWFGKDVSCLSPAALRALRERTQIVFQDPLASLNPLMNVGDIVAEPLKVHRPTMDPRERARRVVNMLERVGLSADMASRYPHEFSGGQCQRIGIARAMVLHPSVLVCDEAVSALDVSVQGQIVNLLLDLKDELGVAIVFVSHNLAVVRYLCDRLLVLYLGQMMEQGPAEQVFAKPWHPYTRSLLAAVPVPDPEIQPARLQTAPLGELPSLLDAPAGCPFESRCPRADRLCADVRPTWREIGPEHYVACHHAAPQP